MTTLALPRIRVRSRRKKPRGPLERIWLGCLIAQALNTTVQVGLTPLYGLGPFRLFCIAVCTLFVCQAWAGYQRYRGTGR